MTTEMQQDNIVQQTGKNATQRIDLLTIAAIAVVVYLLSTIAHEALGHGLTALLVGLHPNHVSSVDLDVSFAGAPDWKMRLVAATGCGGNIVLSLIAFALFPLTHRSPATTRFFLWLLSTINLLVPGGYLMVLTFAGFGDWNDFVAGLPSPLLWKTGLTLLGIIISLLGLFLGVRNLDPFVGRAASGPERRGKRGVKFTFTTYLAGSIVATLASIFNPVSPLLILISAAASTFGGTAFLMFINSFVRGPRPDTPEVPLTPTRSWLWIGLGIAATLVYFLVLGPGLPR